MGATHISPWDIIYFDTVLCRTLQTPQAEPVQVRVIKDNAVLRLKPKEEEVEEDAEEDMEEAEDDDIPVEVVEEVDEDAEDVEEVP